MVIDQSALVRKKRHQEDVQSEVTSRDKKVTVCCPVSPLALDVGPLLARESPSVRLEGSLGITAPGRTQAASYPGTTLVSYQDLRHCAL